MESPARLELDDNHLEGSVVEIHFRVLGRLVGEGDLVEGAAQLGMRAIRQREADRLRR